LPRHTHNEDTPGLTKAQKAIGICLLLFYLAMIGVTIATLPYVVHIESSPVY
jgi:hypothetical protein